MPNSEQEEELEKFEKFGVEAVAGRRYSEQNWMYLIMTKDWEKIAWVWAEDSAGSKEQMDKWNAAH
jgi:hypothetical protein